MPNIINKMSKGKIALIAVLFILLLVTIRVIFMYFHLTPEHPHVEHGVVDLRQWNFNDQETLILDGEWEFYPSLFLDPEDTESTDLQSQSEWIQVPGNWNNSTGIDSGHGFGTYRLRVLISDNEELYGIRVPSIQTASRLFINGQLQNEIGYPTETAKDNKARNVPFSSSFHTDTNEIEIMLHVSNYQFPDTGGIQQSIKFGTVDAVANEKFTSISMQMMVCVVLLLQCIYMCILYALGYRKRELTYLGALTFCMLISTLVDDDKLLLVWIPLNLEWTVKIRLIAYFGSAVFLILFSKKILINDRNPKFDHLFAILCILCSLLILVLPINYYEVLKLMLAFIMLLAIILVPTFALKAIFKGEVGSIFLFLSGIAISINIVLGGFLKSRLLGDLPYYPFDLIISILGLASFSFIRFSKTSERAEKLATKLTKMDKVKDDFLANTSHELRTPLHGMINMAQAVLKDGSQSLDAKSKDNLELITTLGERMSIMLNDLLDVTQLKEHNIRLNKQSVALQGVVSGVFDILRYMTDGKSIKLVNDIPEPFPKVIVDENRLVQILFNLIHNAIKYTNEGIILVHSEYKDGLAYIHVKDSGIGIDEEAQNRIFQPYEQVDSSMTAIGGGLGLGLSICKQLVELHGGTIELESSPDRGSVFTFTLPIDPNIEKEQIVTLQERELNSDHMIKSFLKNESRNAWIPPLAISDVRRPRVLAVDDDPVNLKILKNILSEDHYDITLVTSGKDALTWLDKGDWDIIIADVMMPHMSGYELTRTIREKFSISELPILLLTARSKSEDIYTGFLSGANDYVTKPVGGLELKTRVRALTDLKQSITERLRIEAAWLQAQIQPHFVFNTLNTIASLSDTDTTRMVILLEKFGEYLRTSFENRNRDRVVPLHHELELLRAYVYIEQERFGDRLQVVWHVPNHINIELPPLSIQPLVENAVRHGVLTRTRGGIVTISISENDDHVEISIVDDGKGMDKQKLESLLVSNPNKKNGIGLINTDRRLKQIYGKGLQIRSSLDEGTSVTFTIPKFTIKSTI
jgi:two-component system sensor histidine kinase ChiS